MFGTKKNYILTINNLSELRLEESGSTNSISRLKLDGEMIYEGNNIDEIQLTYVLNKFLSEVNENDNLLIRYSSPKNIFRIKKVEGIDENDLDGYIKYNLDELIPFSKDNLAIESQVINEYVAVFGINKNVLKHIENILKELNFQNIYFTLFTSELLNFWGDNNSDDFIFFNIEDKFLEYFIIEQSEFKEYRIINLEDISISGGAIPEDKIIDQMYLILKEIFQSIDSLETKVLYSIGDWTLINIWNIVMFDKFKMKITARPFDVKKYFGVIK